MYVCTRISHSFAFPYTTCVIATVACIASVIILPFHYDRKKKNQVNALMKKGSYDNI